MTGKEVKGAIEQVGSVPVIAMQLYNPAESSEIPDGDPLSEHGVPSRTTGLQVMYAPLEMELWSSQCFPMVDAVNNNEYDYLMKILLIGEQACGKSTLLQCFVDEQFSETYISTIGVDFKIKQVCAGGKHVKLQVWDTAGAERFRTITSSYYRGANAIFLCYDTSKVANLNPWFADVKRYGLENVPVYVVGLKGDLPPSKEMEDHVRTLVEEQELDAWRWITVSAKNTERVEMPYYAAAVNFVQKNIQENERSERLANKPASAEEERERERREGRGKI
jgi:Ras-related protein Rab-1A